MRKDLASSSTPEGVIWPQALVQQISRRQPRIAAALKKAASCSLGRLGRRWVANLHAMGFM